jgi:hypothetical protein
LWPRTSCRLWCSRISNTVTDQAASWLFCSWSCSWRLSHPCPGRWYPTCCLSRFANRPRRNHLRLAPTRFPRSGCLCRTPHPVCRRPSRSGLRPCSGPWCYWHFQRCLAPRRPSRGRPGRSQRTGEAPWLPSGESAVDSPRAMPKGRRSRRRARPKSSRPPTSARAHAEFRSVQTAPSRSQQTWQAPWVVRVSVGANLLWPKALAGQWIVVPGAPGLRVISSRHAERDNYPILLSDKRPADGPRTRPRHATGRLELRRRVHGDSVLASNGRPRWNLSDAPSRS